MTFEEWWVKGNWLGTYEERLRAKAAWQAATEAEREACAKVCEDITTSGDWADSHEEIVSWGVGTSDCADAIRARSTTEGE